MPNNFNLEEFFSVFLADFKDIHHVARTGQTVFVSFSSEDEADRRVAYMSNLSFGLDQSSMVKSFLEAYMDILTSEVIVMHLDTERML